MSEQEIETAKLAAFKAEIESVCRKHGIGIGHEDTHGGFVLHPIDEDLIEWWREARTAQPYELRPTKNAPSP